MDRLKRYTLPIVLGALALIALVIGVLSVTVWKPAQEVTADRDATQPFLTTRAGVLRLYEPYQDSASVRVEATAPEGETIWIALGDPDDVSAWLTNDSYDEIVGLESIDTLKIVPHDAADTPQSEDQSSNADEGQQSGEEAVAAENPIDSDMWTALKYGNGSVSMTLSGDELDQALLAATDGVGPAPTLKLIWDTPRPNILAMITFPLAGVLAVLSLGTFIALLRTRNKSVSRTDGSSPALVVPSEVEDEALTGATAVAPELAQEEVLAAPETSLEAEPTEETELREGWDDSVTADDVVGEEAPMYEEASSVEEFSPTEAAPEAEEAPSYEEAVPEATSVEEFSPTGTAPKGDDALASEELVSVEGFAPAEEASPVPESPSYEDEASEAVVVDNEASSAEQETPQTDPEDMPAERPDSGIEETVSTDSGMINLSSLSAGLSFPTRRALREAEMRGVDTLVVGERRFSTKTGQIPKISLDDAEDQKQERSGHTLSWAQLMERASRSSSSEPEDPESKGE